jgi:hypothetical protein
MLCSCMGIPSSYRDYRLKPHMLCSCIGIPSSYRDYRLKSTCNCFTVRFLQQVTGLQGLQVSERLLGVKKTFLQLQITNWYGCRLVATSLIPVTSLRIRLELINRLHGWAKCYQWLDLTWCALAWEFPQVTGITGCNQPVTALQWDSYNKLQGYRDYRFLKDCSEWQKPFYNCKLQIDMVAGYWPQTCNL